MTASSRSSLAADAVDSALLLVERVHDAGEGALDADRSARDDEDLGGLAGGHVAVLLAVSDLLDEDDLVRGRSAQEALLADRVTGDALGDVVAVARHRRRLGAVDAGRLRLLAPCVDGIAWAPSSRCRASWSGRCPRIVFSAPRPVAFVTPATPASVPARQGDPRSVEHVEQPAANADARRASRPRAVPCDLGAHEAAEQRRVRRRVVFSVVPTSVEKTPVPTAKLSGGVNPSGGLTHLGDDRACVLRARRGGGPADAGLTADPERHQRGSARRRRRGPRQDRLLPARLAALYRTDVDAPGRVACRRGAHSRVRCRRTAPGPPP